MPDLLDSNLRTGLEDKVVGTKYIETYAILNTQVLLFVAHTKNQTRANIIKACMTLTKIVLSSASSLYYSVRGIRLSTPQCGM